MALRPRASRWRCAPAAALAFLFLAAASPASGTRFAPENERMDELKRLMGLARDEVSPLLKDLNALQGSYAEPAGFVETQRKRTALLARIQPSLDGFDAHDAELERLLSTTELQKVVAGLRHLTAGHIPSDAGEELARARQGRELMMRFKEFRAAAGRELQEDAARFELGRRSIEAARQRRLVLAAGGSAAAILALLGALFLKLRRLAAERTVSLLTDPALPGPAPARLGGPPAARDTLGPGDTLDGNYRVDRELGRGGMGIVYEATDLSLDRKVAVKRMHREIAGGAREADLFLVEARVVAKLKHPNIVEIYAILREGGDLFLIFEHIAGHPLSAFVQGGKPHALGAAQKLIPQIAAALDYAHSQRVVHRDLKPANIMVSAQGIAKVMDFGIAHEARKTLAVATRGLPWGTPAYMAPEQELGTVSREVDVFALGVCLYELLTGKLPFPGPNFLAQKQGKVYHPPSRLAPGLPPGIDAVLARALAADPRARYHRAGELAAALRNL